MDESFLNVVAVARAAAADFGIALSKLIERCDKYHGYEQIVVDDQKRELRIQCVGGNEGLVCFKIAKQTHRGRFFAYGGDTYRASNGMKIHSYTCPGFSCSDVLCVRGDRVDMDDTVLQCTPRDFVRICEAVSDYNKRA